MENIDLLQDLNLQEFIAIDVETTGLDSRESELIEVGAVRFVDGKESDRLSALIKPKFPIPLNISKLTGIYDKDVKDAQDVSGVLPEFAKFLGATPVVGHNVRFDLSFLDAGAALLADDLDYIENMRSGEYLYFDNLYYDTFDLAKVFNPILKSYRLGALCDHYKIKLTHAHRAVEDAAASGVLFVRLLLDGINFGEKTFFDMQQLMGPTRDSLGKIFKGYLEWLSKNEQYKAGDLNRFWTFIANHYNIIGKVEDGHPEVSDDPPHLIDTDEVLDVFSAEGSLAKRFPQYEIRPPQLDMTEAVNNTLNKGHFLTVEAGTGIGKSLAYLVPAIKFAVQNRPLGQRVIVSTNTKNLQEQLFYKDLPQLSAVLEEEFSSVLLKGKGNYLCLDRFYTNLSGQQQRLSLYERKAVLPLITWSRFTQTGDIAENNGFQVERNASIWTKFIAENNYCPGRKCRHYNDCFLMKARNSSRKADLVLINHSLLFSDLVSENSVLGEYANVIFDEAHNLEKTATEYLGVDLNFWIIRRLAHKIFRKDSKETGLAIQFAKNIEKASLSDGEKEILLQHADKTRQSSELLIDAATTFFTTLTRLLLSYRQEKSSPYQNRIAFNIEHQVYLQMTEELPPIIRAVDDLSKKLDQWGFDLSKFGEDSFPFQEQSKQELSAAHLQSTAIFDTLNYFADIDSESMVNWFELPRKEEAIDTLIRAVPLNVAAILEDKLFNNLRSAVFASATLVVNGNFKYFAGRVGINNISDTRKNGFVAGSPFDFKKQVKVMVAGFLPDPRHADYVPRLIDFIHQMRQHTQKGTLILFTSYGMLNRVYENLKFHFDAEKQLLLGQGKDGGRTSIIERFREEKSSVLMGTDSFWEGVDVPGDALELLMLTKLPFEVPTDPVIAARMREVEKVGKNSFFDYSIPEAIIKFRQGFGRLVRSGNDRGAVILTDNRLVKMRYGQQFLNSLPVKADIYHDQEDFLESLNKWFS